MINKDFEIDFYGKSELRLVAFNTRLANKLNKNLKQYVDEKGQPSKIKAGEEAVFLITAKDLNLVSILLPKSYDRVWIKSKMEDIIDSGGNDEE